MHYKSFVREPPERFEKLCKGTKGRPGNRLRRNQVEPRHLPGEPGHRVLARKRLEWQGGHLGDEGGSGVSHFDKRQINISPQGVGKIAFLPGTGVRIVD